MLLHDVQWTSWDNFLQVKELSLLVLGTNLTHKGFQCEEVQNWKIQWFSCRQHNPPLPAILCVVFGQIFWFEQWSEKGSVYIYMY
jgi:hypothetical protein